MVIRVPDQRNTRDGYAALDDRLLVLDFQAGNPQAFVEIHRRYSGLARHVCQRFLPNRQDVDEALQETMIRVFQGLHRFNGRYALQPWIARIAKNVSLDILRGRAARPRTAEMAPSGDELPKPGDEADEIVDRLVRRDTVLAVLAELPDAHRSALVLREIEGQSHREIAQQMEITPGQAKALIHRAKGSFRKRWLEKTAERGGLMGIAFLPLVWLLKLTEVVRRVGERAGHAAQAAQIAAPDAITSTVSAGAAPAASGIGERLVAAGVTILVAGSVTVGAAKIVNDRARPESVAAPVANVATGPGTPLEVPEPPPADDAGLERRLADDGVVKNDLPVVEEPLPGPSAEPSPQVEQPPVEEPPAEEPPAEPPPDTSPTPPPPPPVPEWDFSLRVLGAPITDCGCEASPELVTSAFDGRVGRSLSFAQSIKGVAHAPDGAALWPYYLDQSGRVDGSNGIVTYTLVIGTEAGPVFYDGSASLAAVTGGKAGSYTYRFVGSYQLQPGQSEPDEGRPEGLPTAGRVAASVSIWHDGTIFHGAVTLLEA